MNSTITSNDIIEILIEGIIEKYIKKRDTSITDYLFEKHFNENSGKGDCSICTKYFGENKIKRKGKDKRTFTYCFRWKKEL